jgi:hypothetical protein
MEENKINFQLKEKDIFSLDFKNIHHSFALKNDLILEMKNNKLKEDQDSLFEARLYFHQLEFKGDLADNYS